MTQTQKDELNFEWNYSGKAMRGTALLEWLITLLLFGAGFYLTITGRLGNNMYFPVWIFIIVFSAGLWLSFLAMYIYRTWTIRYKLTDHRLYSYRGLFTKISDSTELVYIDDVQLVQTLFDRIFNGGVGRLVIFSSADKTHNKLILTGIENPQRIFEKVDTARAAVRANRAVLAGS